MKDPLIKYLLNSRGYASVMRGVPLEYMESAKDLTSEVLNISRCGNLTLKRDAHSFDLYTRNY